MKVSGGVTLLSLADKTPGTHAPVPRETLQKVYILTGIMPLKDRISVFSLT